MKPELEALEDRCCPSELTTTIPNLLNVCPVNLLQDILVLKLDQQALSQPKGNPNVVFLGDSINMNYQFSPAWGFWQSVGAEDYAVGGQTTQGLLLQLAAGQLGGVHPLAVVLNIGGNNLLQGNTPLDTAEGILADVAFIHRFEPFSQVIVEGVQPGGQFPDYPYRIEGQQTNQLTQQMLAGDSRATFADIGGIFLQSNGEINSSLIYSLDYIHPTIFGYFPYTLSLIPSVWDGSWKAAARENLL